MAGATGLLPEAAGEELDAYLARWRQAAPGRDGVAETIAALARATAEIAALVRLGPLAGALGAAAGGANADGDVQKKLDVLANDAVLKALRACEAVAYFASEEEEEIQSLRAGGACAVAVDPLDGSSNIDVNISVGTIFSVLRCPRNTVEPNEASFLQPGTAQVAAGYALYGPSTLLILSVGNGVHGFTLDREMGSFVYTHPDLEVPEQTSEYAINSSNARYWEPPVQRYVGELQRGAAGPRGKDYNMRWVASMVADVHRILTRGGVFMYPMDEKNREKGGKLRLMYEANPMAMLVEQAGGAASTGRSRILDVQPERLHQRIPVILGSRSEVEAVERCYREAREGGG